MRYRREWLERLLGLQRDLRDTGHDLELITEDELHRIRREWLIDPNEPDWEDQLPAIYRRVFDADLDWVRNDAGAFTQPDADLLDELEGKYGVSGTLIRKLLDLEVSMDGLAKRRGMTDRIHSILNEDWESLETVLECGERIRDGGYQEEIDQLQSELASLGGPAEP